jgi:F-type H+-transporting ATPase subunit b
MVSPRRLAFAAMVLVTAWSLWAWAARAELPTSKPAPGANARAPDDQAQKGNGGEEEEQPKPLNVFEFGKETPPLIAAIINFGILVGGYYWLGRKPIAAALVHRRDAIAKDIEEAQKMMHEAEARAKTYQAKLERLEEEMRTARETLVHAGQAEKDRIVAEAEASAARLRKEAEFVIEQEMKQIRYDLWRDTLHSAVTAAEELLKQRVTPADQERIAEDYLIDLGGKPKAPGAAAAPRAQGAENAS